MLKISSSFSSLKSFHSSSPLCSRPRKMALQNRETAHRRIFGRWVNAWKMSLAFNAADHPVFRQLRKERRRGKVAGKRNAFSWKVFLSPALGCIYSGVHLTLASLWCEQKLLVFFVISTCNGFVHKLFRGKSPGWKINDCSRAKMQFIIKMFPSSLAY